MKYPEEYYPHKLKPIVQIVARMVAKNPEMANNIDYLMTSLAYNVEEIKDQTKCPCCDRNMKITYYEADLFDALLLLAMANQVKENLSQGMEFGKENNFTEANKVHLPTLKASNAVIKRSTKCDYLCLIKQPKNWRGTGYWVITNWGWKLLRGEPISKVVKQWEGKLLGRSHTQTTMDEMFQVHRDSVEKQLAKRAAVKADHRAEFADYNPADWTEVSVKGMEFYERVEKEDK